MKPFVLGLTGSIGMGKSAVAAMFAKLAVPVFDADAVVRQMQGPGGALIPAIEAAFPGVTDAGGVDRAKLGAAVFGNERELSRLEEIVHPAVRAARAQFLLEHATAALVVYDIPLLFEKGGADEVDAVVVVSAPAEVQRDRVLRRPGMTADRFAQILSHQMPDSAKRLLADHVIETGGSLEATERQVVALVDKLRG